MAMSALGVPMRKRTEKACDQCRRRKTKCDGHSTCKTCSGIGLQCSYGNRVRQARGPKYVVQLEQRLQELENENQSRRSSISSGSQSTPEGRTRGCEPLVTSFSKSRISGNFSSHQSYDSQSSHSSPQQSTFSPDSMSPAHGDPMAAVILKNAKELLEGMAPTNNTAAQCLLTLNPLYHTVNSSPSQGQAIPDFTMDNSCLPDLGFDLDAFNPNVFALGSELSSTQQPPFHPMWSDWNYNNYAVPNMA